MVMGTSSVVIKNLHGIVRIDMPDNPGKDRQVERSISFPQLLLKDLDIRDLDVKPYEYFKELKNKFYHSIDSMSSEERSIISLYYYEELTKGEIGEVMDMTVAQVSEVKSDALVKLKNIKSGLPS